MTLFLPVRPSMRKGRRSTSLIPQDADTPSVDMATSRCEVRQCAGWGLLRPKAVETGVLISDVFLIVATGIVCSLAYHWTIGSGGRNVAAYVGVSLVIA